MNVSKPIIVAINCGVGAALIGLLAFTINWHAYDHIGKPLASYQFFLFPGNLTLQYIWHPIFTEEISFWLKLMLLLIGQFLVVSISVYLFRYLINMFICEGR